MKIKAFKDKIKETKGYNFKMFWMDYLQGKIGYSGFSSQINRFTPNLSEEVEKAIDKFMGER